MRFVVLICYPTSEGLNLPAVGEITGRSNGLKYQPLAGILDVSGLKIIGIHKVEAQYTFGFVGQPEFPILGFD